MVETYWFLIIGGLLLGLAITPPPLRAIPISTSIVYLAVGIMLGPGVLGLLSWDAVQEVHLFEHLTEIAVIVSLFTVGLNMRRSLTDTMWFLPVRLATLTMVLTIGAVAAAIEYGLSEDLAQRLTALVLSLVAVSILVHGVSVSPLMRWYGRTQEARVMRRAES